MLHKLCKQWKYETNNSSNNMQTATEKEGVEKNNIRFVLTET